MIVRYDMQGDDRKIHPQEAFKKDGLVVIRAEASSYGACWFLEIEPMECLPKWYSTLDHFNFTHPEKTFFSDL